jgi:hypothetical protein
MTPMQPTSREAMDQAVALLQERKRAFAALSISNRLELLHRLAHDTFAVAAEQAAAACAAKGIDPTSPRAAEEWLGGPMTTLRNVRLLHDSLSQTARWGHPQLNPNAVRLREDGQVVVDVFPLGFDDKLLFSGFRGEIWMDPALRAHELVGTMARIYQPSQTQAEGAVALVLGAGNVASIGPMDVLYKLFVENQVCILKMNPVNEYLGPFVERGFRALIEAGYLKVVYGGADEGSYLVQHPGVEEIHITGSDFVHDIIVWGPPGEGQRQRKAEGRKEVNKRITSELGCVTPVIITPGRWTDAELDFQAQNVATMMTNNASFNCNAAKVLVTSAAWPQRDAFLKRLQAILAEIPTRLPYYPGAGQRFDRFLTQYGSQSVTIGERTPDRLPWALIPGLDVTQTDQMAFTTEAWCGVLAEAPLPESDPAAFLKAAVKFCNQRLWGTLSCSLLIDPRTEKAASAALEQAIADLRYGSVAVNHWAALSYGLVVTTWGAFPGHTLEDIGSGIGVVHNTMMFEHPQKSVIRGPFKIAPKPPWFATHRNALAVAQRLTRYEYKPSLWQIPGVAINAFKG